jgi:hypothetical protein
MSALLCGLTARVLIVLALTVLVGGSASALPFGPQGPKAVTFQPEDPVDAVSHFSGVALPALKGVRRVVVPQFQVEYVTRSQGLTRKERNQVTVEYAIDGVSDQALQGQTNKLRDRFVASLRAAGVEVVPRDQMVATAAWTKLAAIGKPSGGEFKSESGAGRLFTADATPYYFYPGDTHLGLAATGWGFAQAQMAEQALGQELNAAVVTVRLVVGIRETDKHSQAFALLRTASSFIGDPKLAIEAQASGIYVVAPGKTGGMMNPTGRAGFSVKDTLVFSEDVLTPTLKNANGASGTAGNAVSSALFAGNILASMAGGGMGMKLYKNYKFVSTPTEGDYVAAVDRNLSGAQDAMVAQFTAAVQ